MAFSFETTHGTTFLYNKGLVGNVTIIRGTEQITVPASDLVEFVGNQHKAPPGAVPPYLERAPGKDEEPPA